MLKQNTLTEEENKSHFLEKKKHEAVNEYLYICIPIRIGLIADVK